MSDVTRDESCQSELAAHPSLAVIICTKDRGVALLRATRSLVSQDRRPDALVVVDSGSDVTVREEVVRVVAGRFPFTYLRSAPGLPRQRNVGVRHCRADLLQFLDDDVVADPSFLGEMEAAFRRNSALDSLGAIQGLLREPQPAAGKGGLQVASQLRRVWTAVLNRLFLLPTFGRGHLKMSGFGTTPRGGRQDRVIETVGGCCCVSRHVFETVRFDERLPGPAWMEDIDFARSLAEAGFKVVFAPFATYLHAPSSDARPRDYEFGLTMIRNHHYLHRKHRSGSWAQRIAFHWSVLGLAVTSVLTLEWDRARGVCTGIVEMATGQNPLLADDSQSST